MNVKFLSSITDYMSQVNKLLMKKEANNNLMLGILEGMKTQSNIRDINLGLVLDNAKVIYAFMRKDPNHWILADIEDTPTTVIREMCAVLREEEKTVPSVIGPPLLASAFAEEWKRLSKTTAKVQMKQLIYRLDDLRIKPDKAGELQQAKIEHEALAAGWLKKFGDQANATISAQNARETADRFIANGSLYLWYVDENPVSMANCSRKTENGATINAVFTPDAFKRNGYATNAVAALTAKLLDDGFSFTSLYTDASNPTSNSIYQKIGYQIVGHSIVYVFYK